MQKQLGQRYADALAWRLETRGSTHIGSLLPAGPGRRPIRGVNLTCGEGLRECALLTCRVWSVRLARKAVRPIHSLTPIPRRGRRCSKLEEGGRHCDKALLVSAHVAARASAAKQQAAKTAPGLGKLSICRGERVGLGRAGHCHWPPLHPLGECGFARAGWLRCPLRLRLCQEQTCMFPWASGQMPPAGPSLVRAQSPGRPVGGFGGTPPASLSP
jgi:hypothetical protein